MQRLRWCLAVRIRIVARMRERSIPHAHAIIKPENACTVTNLVQALDADQAGDAPRAMVGEVVSDIRRVGGGDQIFGEVLD